MSAVLPREPAPVATVLVEPARIRDCATSLLGASSRADDLGTFVATGARLPDFVGGSSVAYHERIVPLGAGADAMSMALRAVARRVDVHADRMQHLLHRNEHLQERRVTLVHQIAAARAHQASELAPHPGLDQQCDTLRTAVEVLEADVRAWTRAVTAEEDAMVAAFARLMSIESVQRRFGGVADPADAALATVPPPGSDAAQVHAWWAGLSPLARRAVVAAAPGALGNLDGVPARVRDHANTAALDRDLAQGRMLEQQGLITPEEQRALDNAEAARTALDRTSATLDPVTGEPVVAQLHTYDPAAFGGDGAVAVAVGDLDTADDVTVLVPGFGTDARDALALTGRAAAMYAAARTLDPTRSDATLAWIGYDAPDNLPGSGQGLDALGVGGEQMATAGGDRLADTVDGLRAGRDAPAHLTVVGHSYGSTTVGHALHDHHVDVDDVAVVGSPGMGGHVHHPSDLGVDPDHFYAGANSRDPVPRLADDGVFGLHDLAGAGLGDDPAEDGFGGTRFEAESTTRPDHLSFAQHSAYWDPGSESLYDLAHVVTGHGDGVLVAAGVHDPLLGPPSDPEAHRLPTSPHLGAS